MSAATLTAKAPPPETPHVNGTTVAMPIKKITITFDAVGYPGWKAILRLNPRAEVYDKLLQTGEGNKSWEGMAEIVLEWNFGDEEGNPLPLPKDGTNRDHLPMEVGWHMYNEYVEAFNKQVELPKVPELNSADTSQTADSQ